MGSKDPILLLRLQASYENGEQQRTSVKRWMTDNYDDLTAKFDEMFPNGRINWIWLTAWLQDQGFRNGSGSDLKKDTVQKIWRRVNEEREKKRPSRARQVREIGEAATAGRNDLFRQPVTPERMPQPVVRVESLISPERESGLKQQAVSGSVPQAESVENKELSPSERANALMLAEMDKRSGRG